MSTKEVDETPIFDASRALRTYFHRGRMKLLPGQISVFESDGVEVMFNVVNDRDLVQRLHLGSHFFEHKDLALFSKYFPKGGVFADIGANVGNHSVYAAKILGASKVIPFEPNPIAQEIYINNAILNRMMEIVDFSFLTYGLSNTVDEGLAMHWNPNNLGGGRIVRANVGGGEVSVIRGDDALKDRNVDFLKIDVEGAEMDVLEGLEATISDRRPNIFIEIGDRSSDAFFEWVEANDYEIAERIRHYAVNENFMITPKEGRDARN
ncbi:FkbM family methyltransferase [Paracoccaceae bacterium GXU_MW_L88]